MTVPDTPASAQPIAAQATAPTVSFTPAPSAPSPLVAGTTAPANQLFAAAIEASSRQDRVASATGNSSQTDPFAALGFAPATTAPVTGVSAGQPAIDMRHGAWPSQMIEQIEKLRDTADAGSTRIRVSPDALGSIDVSLRRHDSGAVQVALIADRPATQTLIAEARPELSRLGEQRGLRFDTPGNGSTSTTGGGANGQGAGTSQRRSPAPDTARAATATPITPDTTDAAETRVA